MADELENKEVKEEAHTPESDSRAKGGLGADMSVDAFLQSITVPFEEVQLPSKGLFYDDALVGGVVHVRPMTMKEEKLLATSRLVRSGKALDMIFSACLKEKVDPQNLLSVDRTFLLIWLRGISYGSEYDVQVKCPSCGSTFPETVDLSDLPVNFATEEMSEPFHDILPRIKHPFSYRLARGYDETAIARHKERVAKAWGDDALDDTRVIQDRRLVESIANFTDKSEIEVILETLTMEDASYLKNNMQNPGFGVETRLDILCPMCHSDFNLELPIDANFFFPRRTKKRK